MKTYLTFDKQLRCETDLQIIFNLERKGWVLSPQPQYNPETQQCNWIDGEWVVTPIPPILYNANAWLEKEGYGPTQLVTLLDLTAQLQAVGKVSPKLDAVRLWTNMILAEYVQSPTPKEDWGNSPFSFSETVTEAFNILNE